MTGRLALAFSRMAGFWRRSTVARMAAPVLCLCYDVMMFTRMVFLRGASDHAASMIVERAWGLVLLAALCLVSVTALLFRTRWPFATLCVIYACYLCASLLQTNYYMTLPLLFALYSSTVLTESNMLVAGGVLLAAVTVICGSWLSTFPRLQVGMLLPMAFLTTIVIIPALWSRSVRQRRRDAALVEGQRRRNAELEAQRDEERRRSGIAAELHDSVGHNLTAIIALTEGLEGMTEEPVEGAVATINDLARKSLNDTREAVQELSSPRQISQSEQETQHLHTWNEIGAVLDHARAAGITAALTETGRRQDDSTQADICFRISRESITNILRHARQTTRIVVSWDHCADGTLDVTVRDDGKVDDGVAHSGGTGLGLTKLKNELEAIGGRLSYGPMPQNGWTVKAEIPGKEARAGFQRRAKQ